MGYQAKKVLQSNHWALKKSGFSILFAKNSPEKNVGRQKFCIRSITTLPMQLSKKETDVFVEKLPQG